MRLSYRFSDGFEVKSQINQYKRCDVFVCQQEGHRAFDHRVSVYHVLKEKCCYPYGCVSFVWKCLRLNKGLSCPRGFQRAGRMCFGCKSFVDEKINPRPKLIISAEDFEVFKRDLHEFECWLEGLRGREVNVSGTVHSVKPHLTVDPSRKWRLSFHGFLVVLREGFLNLVHLKDFCYLRLSGRMQERYRFRPGDCVDFFGRCRENRGRIILTRVNRIEIENRAEGFWWNESKARVAVETGTLIEEQPEKCLSCEKSCLIDVRGKNAFDPGAHRRLFCLEGVRDPRLCPRVSMREEMWEEYGCGVAEDGSSNTHRLASRLNTCIEPVTLNR